MTRSQRANEPEPLRRMALAPGLLGAIAAIVGVFAIGNELFFVVSFVIAGVQKGGTTALFTVITAIQAPSHGMRRTSASSSPSAFMAFSASLP